MKIKAVFFDLDGTLLPMDQDEFIKAYLGGLVKTLAPCGYDPDAIGKALWASTHAMMQNDGSVSNEQVFWKSFCSILGDGVREEEDRLAKFYETDFHKIKDVCGYNTEAKKIVDSVRNAGLRVILATSPLFPTVATYGRIFWAGLSPSDFEYITTYENSCYCKPNPLYYTNLLEKMNLRAEECVMIGNDVGDDMIAQSVGMQVFLLTDDLINRHEKDITKYRRGSYADLNEFIEEIINEKY